jgi:hypothetical protein
MTREQVAQRRRSQAQGAAVLRTAGNALNTIIPGPNNPLLAADLEDLSQHPLRTAKNIAARVAGVPTGFVPGSNAEAANRMLFKGDVNALNDRYLGLGGPHLAALRGKEVQGSGRVPLDPYNPVEAGVRLGKTFARYGYNPLRFAAAEALEHPYLTAGAGIAADAVNPLGNAPTDIVRAGVTAAARRGARAVSESAARLAAEKAAGGAAAARDATMASAMGNGPLKVTPAARTRDRFIAPLAKVGDALSVPRLAAQGAVDRYATQVGPRARYATHTAEATIGSAAKRVDDLVLKAFGPQVDHLVGNPVVQNAPEGLTRAEMIEVQNRSYQTRGTNLPPHIKDRALEANYVARMKAAGVANPVSLDRRAGWLRQALVNNDRDLVKYGVADPEQLYRSSLFFPMKQYRQRPVYSRFEEPKTGAFESAQAYNSDSMVPLSDLRFLGEGGGGGARGGFVASRRFLSEHKTQPPAYLLDPSELAADYLPSHQVREHLLQSQRAVEQAKALRKLEGVGIEVHGPGTQEYQDLLRIGLRQIDYRITHAKNDADVAAATAERTHMESVLGSIGNDSSPARLPILYAKRETGGATTVMGLGNSGRARAMRLEQRERNAATLTKAQMTIAPDRVDLRDARRLSNVQYLQGAGRGRLAGLRDLANAQRRVDNLGDSLQGSRVPGQWPPSATYDETVATPFGQVTRGAPSSAFDQFGEAVRKPTPLADIAARVRGTADDLEGSGEALRGTMAENKAAIAPAAEDAKMTGAAAKLFRKGEREVQELRKAANETPTRRVIMDVARQHHAVDASEFSRLSPGKLGVRPDWVWTGKRWRMAGEFEDVPKRFLNLEDRPKDPPFETGVGNIVARVHGDLDDVATESGHADGDSLLRWMQEHPRAPRVGDYVEQASRHVEAEIRSAFASRKTETLAKYGLADKTLPEALKSIRSDAKTLERLARASQTEAVGRRAAERNIGPQARATIGTAQQAARTLRSAMSKVESAQNGVVTRVQRTGDAIGKSVEVRLDELDTLGDRLAAARYDRDTYRKIKDEQQRLLGEINETVSEAVDKKWGKLPKGYLPESPLRLGARDSRAFGIEENVGRVLGEPVADPRVRVNANIVKFMRGMDTLGQMVRFGIVAVPTVHVGGNLQMAYLAEFASRGTPVEKAAIIEESARILAGKGTAIQDAALAKRAEDAGALPSHSTTTIGSYDKRQADVMTRSRSELNPLEQIDQNFSHRFYRPSTSLVFDHFEKSYAVDAFKRFTDAGMADDKAAYRVREMFGNYQNVTAFERAGAYGVQLHRLLMFYPWLKTAINFWVRKGILDPNFAVIAPMRGVQANNSIQGYDDPTKPYTLTAGRNDTGEFRRVSLPLPQRILEPLGRAALLPYDTLDTSTWKSGEMAANARSAASIPLNRLNPYASSAHLALDNMSGHAAPYERYFDPKDATPLQIQAANRVGQAFIAPLRNMTDFAGGDPMGAAISQAGLGFSYKVPGNGMTVKRVHDIHARINALRAQGKNAEADDLVVQLRRAQGAPP